MEIDVSMMSYDDRAALLESKLNSTFTATSVENMIERQKELGRKVHDDRMMRARRTLELRKVIRAKMTTTFIERFDNEREKPLGFEQYEHANLTFVLDEEHDTVILHMDDRFMPVNVSMMEKITDCVVSDETFWRIDFPTNGFHAFEDSGGIYGDSERNHIKAVVYKSRNIPESGETVSRLDEVFCLIKKMKKRIETRKAAREKDTLVLIENENIPIINDLSIRPQMTMDDSKGRLEAHNNGLCYISRGQRINILYETIKNAFFQLGEGAENMILHFHLKHEITIGTETLSDVQFFIKFCDDFVSSGASRSEWENNVKNFCKKVEQLTNQAIKFDLPIRKFGFSIMLHGGKDVWPTDDCIINLTDWPPFFISMEDVEIVAIDMTNINEIDTCSLTIVLKNYYKGYTGIEIKSHLLDHVKKLFNSFNIYYTEYSDNIDWIEVLHRRMLYPTKFFDDGGWATVLRPI